MGHTPNCQLFTNSEDMLHDRFQLRPGPINASKNAVFLQKSTKTLVEASVAPMRIHAYVAFALCFLVSGCTDGPPPVQEGPTKAEKRAVAEIAKVNGKIERDEQRP